MQLKKDTTVVFIAQIYSAATVFISLPMYLHTFGPEVQGLIGFLILLTGLISFFDIGMGPSLGRLVAVSIGNKKELSGAFVALKKIEKLILGISLTVIVVTTLFFHDMILLNWIKSKNLDNQQINISLICLGLIVSMRWLAGTYRSVIAGFEKHSWLAKNNALFSTLRAFSPLLPFLFFDKTQFSIFFITLLAISIIEATILKFKIKQEFEDRGFDHKDHVFNLKDFVKLSGGMAAATTLWLIVSQMDRILLSKILTLEEFGYFSLIMALCGALTQLSLPVVQTLGPRLSSLYASGDLKNLKKTYLHATDFLFVIIMPVAFFIAIFPQDIIMLWTSNSTAANWAAKFLPYYILGSAISTLISVLFILQFSSGKIKIHLILNIIGALIYIPALYISIQAYQAKGSAYAWLIYNLIILVTFPIFIHRKLKLTISLEWFVRLLQTIIVVLLYTGLIYLILNQTSETNHLFRYILLFFSGLLLQVYLLKSYLSGKVKSIFGGRHT